MKDIKNYEGLYAVTSCGKVWSYRSKKFLKPIYNNRGYPTVKLSKDGKPRTFHIHKLVAEAYTPNPLDLPHKNETRTVCHVNNLELDTAKQNNAVSKHRGPGRPGKSVYCVELDRVFENMTAAGRELGISIPHISECCRGLRKTCNGYHWCFTEPIDG